MKRTIPYKSKKVSAILCADFHLREDIPVCRTDDFQEAQWKKVIFIKDLQHKHNCPVVHAGDLFNHWKPSPALLTKTMQYLPKQFITIYGNHDLPQHNLELAYKCGIRVLEEAGKIKVLGGCHWLQTPTGRSSLFFPRIDRKALVWHVMTYEGNSPWPGCTDTPANKLLRQYSNYDFILTGHNHKCFIQKDGKRILLNPGSLTRQAIDQVEHRPSVFLYYAETNTVERIYLPIEKEVMSRAHIDVKECRDARIEAFVERLNTEWQKGVSFEENLEHFLANNDITDPVIKVIEKAIDNEKN